MSKKAKKVTHGGKSPKSKAQKAKQQKVTRQKINAGKEIKQVSKAASKSAKAQKQAQRKAKAKAEKERQKYKKWERERRKKDKEAKEHFDDEKKKAFDKGKLVYEQILAMINQARDSGFGPGADHLLTVLQSEINIYGRESVFYSMAEASMELIEDAQIAVRYDEGSYPHDTAITSILEIIRSGEPLSMGDINNLYSDVEETGDDLIEALSSQEMYEMGIYEE